MGTLANGVSPDLIDWSGRPELSPGPLDTAHLLVTLQTNRLTSLESRIRPTTLMPARPSFCCNSQLADRPKEPWNSKVSSLDELRGYTYNPSILLTAELTFPMKPMQAATSIDVARRAGVSQATVSLVLNRPSGRQRVSPATRERVLQAAHELGYSPHPLAQNLRKRRSGIIAFVPRSTQLELVRAPVPILFGLHLARIALQHGFHVVEAGAAQDCSASSSALLTFLRRYRVDGIIFDSPEQREPVAEIVASGIPTLQVIRPLPDVAAPALLVDPYPGITAAVAHLHALGHRAIAFIGRGGTYPVDHLRLEAFQCALDHYGIPLAAQHLALVTDYDIQMAYCTAQTLFAETPQPTAVFCSGDNLALGLLRALYERRLRVPDDVSVVSYDDAYGGDLYPPLSSVVQPIASVAKEAVVLLQRLMTSPQHPADHLTLIPTHYVERDSTASCPLADAPTMVNPPLREEDADRS